MTHIEANAAAHERHEDEAAEFELWAEENAFRIWREVFVDGGYCGLCAEEGFDFDAEIFAHAAAGHFLELIMIGRKFELAAKKNANAKEAFDKIAADMWRKVKEGVDK